MAATARQCLLYLSPGPDASLPWGGLHVTIVGRSLTGAGSSPAGLRAAARAAVSDPQTIPPVLPAQPAEWQPRLAHWRVGCEKLWVVEFANAPPLTALSVALASRGVHGVKGPLSSERNNIWHLTLPSKVAREQAAAQAWMRDLLAPGALPWKLWVVEEEARASNQAGDGLYVWSPL